MVSATIVFAVVGAWQVTAGAMGRSNPDDAQRLLGGGHNFPSTVHAAANPNALAVNQLAGTNQTIVQTAMEIAEHQPNTFLNHVSALGLATQQHLPGFGQVTKLGEINGWPVYGSTTSSVAIANLDGVTMVVQKIGPTEWQILGRFLPQ
jgi:hypothetical protein